MIQTIVQGGTVVHDWGREQAWLGIDDGRIVGIYEPGTEPYATEVIDATGGMVIPGVVEMHSHHRQGTEPGFECKEDSESVTRACAAGGVTSTVAMPNIQPPPNTTERLDQLFRLYERNAVVDWSVNPAGTVLEEIPASRAWASQRSRSSWWWAPAATTRTCRHRRPRPRQIWRSWRACAAADVP